MTLDKAIKHAEEVAEEKQKDYERACAYNIPSEGCLECAKEHRQLAGWLKELRALRKQKKRSYEDWEYLKKLITDVRDADGRANQKNTCQYILNLMEVIENRMK